MRYFLIACLLLLTIESQAQRWTRDRQHLIVGLGGTGFMGELGGADDIGTQGLKDFNFAALRPSFLVGYRYFIFEKLAVTGNFTFGYVSGSDELTTETFRNNRNIHFRSPILELSSTGELYFFRLQSQGARYTRLTRRMGIRNLNISAYIFTGIAGFYFNPQGYFDGASYNGSVTPESLPPDGWYSLRPLSTEGQGFFSTREKYSRVSLAIPFGLGFTVNINQDIAVGFQYGFRKTFTDYIDDVSTTYVDPKIFNTMFDDPGKIALAEYFANPTNNQLSKSVTAPGQQRGNPYNSDAYMFGFITLHYRLPDFGRIYGTTRF
jgi:hypothetical protein